VYEYLSGGTIKVKDSNIFSIFLSYIFISL